VAALYLAREVVIPFALALLLSFLLGPLVTRLQIWGFRRIPSVVCALALGFLILGFATAVISFQVVDLATDLPNYEQNLRSKIQKLKVPKGGGVGRVMKMFGELERDLPGPTEVVEPTNSYVKTNQEGTNQLAEPKPIPVEVHSAPTTSVQLMRGLIGSVWSPLATAGIVGVFTIFMLIQREDLRDRLLRLVGADQLSITTDALDDAAGRVSRYLAMQLTVNLCYGIP